ncbi:MAG: hypothetical protein UDQ18_04900 [Faecalibacterium sp.]|nr:hypothetical protein [Faecalibacterium sp.]
MKHKAFRWIPAVLLAALLAGCGAKTAASARPAGSRELKSTPPDSMHATAAITEQYTLEKVVQAENGGKVRLNIHLPRLESDSADAARINAEIARLYEYDVQEYADCPAAADPDVWDFCMEMKWNASWYNDCVSLVVSSDYGGTDAPFHQGWCFDFDSGKQLTATQLLQRMGADPAALEEALYRNIKRRDELDRQVACERGLLPPGSLKEGNTAWWATLDELPLSFDETGNVTFLIRRFSASREEYVNDAPTIPLDAQPLPQDWEQQVLAEWMAVTMVTEEGSFAPADRNESYILQLEKAEITGSVTITFTRKEYVSPQIRSAAETRAGELNAGAVTRWDGEKSQGWNLTCLSEDGRSRWIISMMEDGSLLMQSTGPQKGSTVWYVFRRMEAWDDIGFSAIPRRLWGTFRAGDAAAGIKWMTFLPDGSCCMSVEWDGWNGILTGTAEGTQGRTEDGTELYFTLTDQNGRPCEFWAILLNDDGSPSGCSLKYRAGEVLFDRDTRPVYWKNDAPDLTLVP